MKRKCEPMKEENKSQKSYPKASKFPCVWKAAAAIAFQKNIAYSWQQVYNRVKKWWLCYMTKHENYLLKLEIKHTMQKKLQSVFLWIPVLFTAWKNKCVKQVLKLSITLVGYPVFGLLTGGVTLSDSIDYVKAAILKEAK